MADGLTPAQLDALDKKHAAPSAPPPVAAAPTPAPPKQGGLTPEELDRMAAPTPRAGSAPAPSKPSAPAGNPFAALKPIVTGAGRAVGSGIGSVFDILNRPHETLTAAATGGDKVGNQTFVHGQSQESQDATRATIRKNIGIADFYNSLSSKTWTSPNGNKIPGHVLQGLIDFAVDTGTDPLTYLAGFGFLEKGAVAAYRAALPAAAKGIERLGQVHPQAAAGLGAAFDFANYKGKTLRALAAKNGAEGIDQFHGLKSINNARMQRGTDLGNTLTHHLDTILKGMPTEDRDAMFAAIHGGTVDKLPALLRAKADAFKRMTDSLAHLSGTRGMRKQLAAEPNLFRGQQGAEVRADPLRGGTFYGRTKDVVDKHYLGEQAEGLPYGGESLIQRSAKPKNVLNFGDDVPTKSDSPLRDEALDRLLGPGASQDIEERLAGQKGQVHGRAYAEAELRKLGVPDEQIQAILKQAGRERSYGIVMDRMAAEHARKQGYDAIRGPSEYFDLGGSTQEAHGFQLPEEFQRFDTQVRSLQRPAQYRQNYVPTAHEMDTPLGSGSAPGSLAELDQRIAGMAKQEAGTRGAPYRSMLEAQTPSESEVVHTTPGLHAEDPNLRERGEHAQMLPSAEQEQVIKARLRSGAKAIAARDAEREVARLFGVGGFAKAPREAQQFFQETWTEPGGKEFWGGLARGLIDIPKVALFALPFRHMANIGTLSIFADPSIANITGTAGKFAQLMLTKDPAARAKILGLAHKYGVTGVPSVDRTAAGWVGKIPSWGGRKIGDIYKASNHALWTFDDAAKATRFQRLLTKYQRTGLKEADAAYKAAADVGAEMIDYSNRSPLTQALAYIAPFATYRSKLPGAVARSVTRHPERVLAAGRASPAMVGDVQQSPGDPKGTKSFLPFADTLRAVDNPAAYVRATAGYPLQMAAGLAEKAIGRAEGSDTLPYSTYHKEPDLKYLANETLGAFPGASYLLDKAGYGEFQGQGSLQNVVGSQTGFNPARVPTLKEMKAQQHIDLERAKIEAARHGGNKALADQLETRLRGYLHYNHTYEK